MAKRPRPLALIILDGWGHREETDANAIAQANIPHWDKLWEDHAHTFISGSGTSVGLPSGQMGNSEVGHLNMGAGRVVYQDLTRIDLAIQDKSFFANPLLIKAIDKAVQSQKAVHVLGLLSPGGVHSHEKQIHALIELAKERHASKVYVHAFLDGRDMPPRSAEASLIALQKHCDALQCGNIVSIIGRYYAMDRDQRWERIQKAYDLLTLEKAEYQAPDALTALKMAYERGETDEFVKPTQIAGPKAAIQEGDTVIYMNFRADRARAITRAFVDPQFDGFVRTAWPKVHFLTLTEYDKTFPVDVAFPPKPLHNILGAYLSGLGLKQLRIAETEKYAHVTFFFNGGIEAPFPGEDRILVPSLKIATYDLQPEMSAREVTERLVVEIHQGKYDVIICNFANPDMVGHTGNLPATIEAIECIDQCLYEITTALEKVGGEALITADHGNAEMMFDPRTEQPHTAHTNEEVPLLYIGRKAKIVKENGTLSDIAPTMLYLLDIAQPEEMTGRSLLKLE